MVRSLSVAFALLGAASVLAEPDGGAGVLTKAPVLLKEVEAQFPPEAQDAGIAGDVVMEVDIGADGKVTDARVVKSAGHGFDEAALAAVKQFEFSPAEVDGVPAPVRIVYTQKFFYHPQVVERPAPAEVVNFAGTLVERGTRTPLANGTVAVEADGGTLESTSDAKGHFEVRDVPPGAWPVVVAVPEHARYQVTETFHEGQRTEATYYVRRQLYGTFETVVRGQRERKEVSEVTLRQEEIRLIPGTEGDAFKVVQNLPGVARSPYGIGLLVVRGGKPWDTRTYVDDAFVPLLFHFGGLYSTFNSNLLQDLTFEPGNFGADYGRGTGGLVRASSRTPTQEGIHGYFDLNAYESSAMVEMPITENWSFAISGARSYFDAVIPAALKIFAPQVNLSFTQLPRFYDWQLKLERRPRNGKDRFVVMLFGSNDKAGITLNNPPSAALPSSFSGLLDYNRLVINWDHDLSPTLHLISHNMVGEEHTHFVLGTDSYADVTSYPFSSRDGLSWDLRPDLTLNVGLDLFGIPYHYVAQLPPPFKLNEIPDPFLSQQLLYEAQRAFTFEPGVYAEAIWKWGNLKVVPGVRADADTYMNKGWIDPRISAFYTVTDQTTLKAGYGLFHQPPDYRQGELSPTFGNPDLLPEGAIHYSVGIEQQFFDWFSLDVTAYYKSLFHLAEPTLAAAPDNNIDNVQPRYLSTGVGRSYGLEVLLRRQLTKNLFGWISYSLSRSELIYPGTTTWALHPLDQPHNLIVVASYHLPSDFIAGIRLQYTSGPLDTPYSGAIYDANGNYYYPLFALPFFSRRLPPFFELDVRIDKRFVFKQWMLAAYVEVKNATNHGNVETVTYNFQYSQSQYVYGLPILPTLGVRGEF